MNIDDNKPLNIFKNPYTQPYTFKSTTTNFSLSMIQMTLFTSLIKKKYKLKCYVKKKIFHLKISNYLKQS